MSDRAAVAERVAGRVAGARRALAAAGIDAPVRAAGLDGEILAVTGSPELRAALARLAPELRELGFRYVALDLDGGHRTHIQDA